METTFFPKNLLRQICLSMPEYDRNQMACSPEQMYMAAFDLFPSVFHIDTDFEWTNKSITPWEFICDYLSQRGFVIVANNVRKGNDKISLLLQDSDDEEQDTDGKIKHEITLFIHQDWKMMVYYNSADLRVLYHIAQEADAQRFAEELADLYMPLFRKKNKNDAPRVNYITYSESDDFELHELEIVPKQNFDINDLYNDDFSNVDAKIRQFIDEPKRSGLVILHGVCGSGKTTYIKDIVAHSSAKFVFIPMDVAEHLTSPDFIDFVSKNLKEFVLVIEDCEQLLFDRAKTKGHINNALVSILNLTDGLLGEALQLKFICTFNNDLCYIDPALLRPGRLVAEYQFTPLSAQKTTSLLNKLGHCGNFESMTLAEIFNY